MGVVGIRIPEPRFTPGLKTLLKPVPVDPDAPPTVVNRVLYHDHHPDRLAKVHGAASIYHLVHPTPIQAIPPTHYPASQLLEHRKAAMIARSQSFQRQLWRDLQRHRQAGVPMDRARVEWAKRNIRVFANRYHEYDRLKEEQEHYRRLNNPNNPRRLHLGPPGYNHASNTGASNFAEKKQRALLNQARGGPAVPVGIVNQFIHLKDEDFFPHPQGGPPVGQPVASSHQHASTSRP